MRMTQIHFLYDYLPSKVINQRHPRLNINIYLNCISPKRHRLLSGDFLLPDYCFSVRYFQYRTGMSERCLRGLVRSRMAMAWK